MRTVLASVIVLGVACRAAFAATPPAATPPLPPAAGAPGAGAAGAAPSGTVKPPLVTTPTDPPPAVSLPKGAEGSQSTLPPLPVGVSSLGAVVADGHVYVYGGHCAKTHTYSTEAVTGTFRRLKLAGGKAWEDLPGGPIVQGLALVAHAGKVYRIGGMQPRNAPGTPADNHSVSDVAVYDPATGKWADLPPLPTGRSSHDAAVVGDQIVVAGGWHMKGADKEAEWSADALVMDLAAPVKAWKSVPQPFHRRAVQAVAWEGKFWLVGGMDPEGTVLRKIAVLDVASGAWSEAPSIPGAARNGFSPGIAVAGGRLVLSPADGKLHVLSPKGDAWLPAGSLAGARLVHRVVGDGDAVIAIGGASKQGNVTLVERVVPAVDAAPGK